MSRGLLRREVLQGFAAGAVLGPLEFSAGCNRTSSPLQVIKTNVVRTLQDAIRNTPHAELHRHTEAGMSEELFAQLAKRHGVTEVKGKYDQQVFPVNPQDPVSLQAFFNGELAGYSSLNGGGMKKFLNTFGALQEVIRSVEDLEEIVYESARDQHQNHGAALVSYRGTPTSYQKHIAGASIPDIMQSLRRGVARARKDFGIEGELIACFSRQRSLEEADQVVRSVLDLHDKNDPIGLDIAGGPENEHPPQKFKDLLALLGKQGVPLTVHAGEGQWPDFSDAPTDFVRQAVEVLGASRIGHGTALAVNQDMLYWVKRNGVHIEACPVSNAIMHGIPLEQHPLRAMLDAGVSVSVSTDDPLHFRTPSTRALLEKFGEKLRLQPQDIAMLTKNACAAAFLPEAKKSVLLEKI